MTASPNHARTLRRSLIVGTVSAVMAAGAAVGTSSPASAALGNPGPGSPIPGNRWGAQVCQSEGRMMVFYPGASQALLHNANFNSQGTYWYEPYPTPPHPAGSMNDNGTITLTPLPPSVPWPPGNWLETHVNSGSTGEGTSVTQTTPPNAVPGAADGSVVLWPEPGPFKANDPAYEDAVPSSFNQPGNPFNVTSLSDGSGTYWDAPNWSNGAAATAATVTSLATNVNAGPLYISYACYPDDLGTTVPGCALTAAGCHVPVSCVGATDTAENDLAVQTTNPTSGAAGSATTTQVSPNTTTAYGAPLPINGGTLPAGSDTAPGMVLADQAPTTPGSTSCGVPVGPPAGTVNAFTADVPGGTVKLAGGNPSFIVDVPVSATATTAAWQDPDYGSSWALEPGAFGVVSGTVTISFYPVADVGGSPVVDYPSAGTTPNWQGGNGTYNWFWYNTNSSTIPGEYWLNTTNTATPVPVRVAAQPPWDSPAWNPSTGVVSPYPVTPGHQVIVGDNVDATTPTTYAQVYGQGAPAPGQPDPKGYTVSVTQYWAPQCTANFVEAFDVGGAWIQDDISGTSALAFADPGNPAEQASGNVNFPGIGAWMCDGTHYFQQVFNENPYNAVTNGSGPPHAVLQFEPVGLK